jgi:type I restriction enzyme S subunit
LENAFSDKRYSGDGKRKSVLPSGWQTVRFDEAAEIASNLVTPQSILDLPHIAPNHIESGRPRLLPYRTIREDAVISGKHRFYPGQLLYSKIRPYLRKVVQVDFEGGCSADMYPINPKCNARYLMYWMLSPQFTWLATRQEGRTVLPKINQAALSSIPTPLAPPEVQERIAARLDEIFARAERLEAEAARARALLDRLESAILAKAFRGELVPQNPNDEPASVLLERIRAQRIASPKPQRGRRAAA